MVMLRDIHGNTYRQLMKAKWPDIVIKDKQDRKVPTNRNWW